MECGNVGNTCQSPTRFYRRAGPVSRMFPWPPFLWLKFGCNHHILQPNGCFHQLLDAAHHIGWIRMNPFHQQGVFVQLLDG